MISPLTFPPSPAHSGPETVQLSLCSANESGQEKTFYTTHFTYYFDQKAVMADLLLQSVYDGGTSLHVHYGLFPPLPSADAVREYDVALTEALQDAKFPDGWNLLGSMGKGEEQRIETVEGEVI